MIKTLVHGVLLLAVTSWAMTVQAVRYQASMHEAQWRTETSRFECRLWQPVPDFGDAVFSSRAGEALAFYLQPTRHAMREGRASLVSRPPQWNPGRQSIDLGSVAVSRSPRSISLGEQQAYRLINELFDGMSPEFSRASRFNEDELVQLALTSINFRKAYRQYQACLAQLLPVNFDQIKRSRILFKTAEDEISPASMRRLQHVVEYVQADPSISGFFIDGHTDNSGRRLYNLELSKKRAEIVARYLIANGIDETKITTRYHGERYPVVSNDSAKNRAMNRRVTIRLERDAL